MLCNKVSIFESESHKLKSNLAVSQNECKTLKEEHQAVLEWKTAKEKLINETEALQKNLKDQINSLESDLSSVNEANAELQVHFPFYLFIL